MQIDRSVTLHDGTKVNMDNKIIEVEVDVEDWNSLKEDPIDVFEGKLGLA